MSAARRSPANRSATTPESAAQADRIEDDDIGRLNPAQYAPVRSSKHLIEGPVDHRRRDDRDVVIPLMPRSRRGRRLAPGQRGG
jgi:hypothetical protein